MKVLYQSRVDLFDIRGGDTYQIENTKRAIEKIDKNIQIDISTELKPENINEYDIVHLYNLDWICETYIQAKYAKENNRKIVLSAIHHSEDEVKLYESKARYDIRRIYNFLIPWQSARDTWKNLYRSFHNHKKFKPTITQMRKGIRNQQREILHMSDIVLVQTDIEAIDIQKDFKIDDFKSEKVVNGVNIDLFVHSKKDLIAEYMKKENHIDIRKNKLLVSVGRIEPRKNQLRLIEAFYELQKHGHIKDYLLVFIGAENHNSFEYLYRFHQLVKKNPHTYYLGPQNQELIASALAHDGVYAQPSWFETTGLAVLEAALVGMPIVTAGNRVREYIGEHAEYCHPEDTKSIQNAILRASQSGRISEEFKMKIKKNYTWENTAKQTIKVYNELLNNR